MTLYNLGIIVLLLKEQFFYKKKIPGLWRTKEVVIMYLIKVVRYGEKN